MRNSGLWLAALALCASSAALADSEIGLALASPVGSAEWLNSKVAKQANAPAAHALNAMGSGVTVGVLDTGINARHQDLAGRVNIAQAYNATNKSVGAPVDLNGHGTLVSSLIAGAMNGVGIYGIAPLATILPVTIFAGSSGNGTEAYFTAGLQYTAGKASIVNLSLGSPTSFGQTAMLAAVRAGQLLVVAAGNSGLANPEWPARYARETWANGQIIAVGAVDTANKMASFSDKAGDTRNFYLVAPGVGDIGASASSNAGYVSGSGTSFAAPVVSGAAAVVKGYWPYLGSQQVASVLFKTATHLGTSPMGVADVVYGWGVVNVGKAVQPVGVAGITMKNGQVVAVAGTSAIPSAALNGAMQTAAAGGAFKVSALDETGRNFIYDLGSTVVKAPGLSAQQVFGASDRQMLFADQVIDREGSRLATAIDIARSTLQFGSMQAFETRSYAQTALAGMALTQKFAGNAEIAFGTMGMQNFFGVTGMELGDAPALSMPAFSNAYFSLVPGATTAGYGRLLADGWKLKLGVMSSRLADVGLSQYGMQARNTGASMSFAEMSRKFGDAVLGVSMGSVSESASFLGMSGQQALAVADTPRTLVTTVNGAWRIVPGMALAAYYSAGSTRAFANGAASLVTGASEVRSNAFGAGLVKSDGWKQGDRLSLSVSQPLRATSGTMILDVASGMTDTGIETRELRSVSLASPARELMLEANYTLPLGKQSSLGFALIDRRNPGNLPGPSENVAAVRYGAAF
jgi:hypothetical protein